MTAEGNKQNAFKAGVWYTVSNIAAKAILVLTTPIFTRMMSTEDYGMASIFTSWYSLLVVFCSLNLTYSIGRAKIDFPGKLDEYVGAMQLLALVNCLVLAGGALLFLGPVSAIMDMERPMVLLLIAYLMCAPTVLLYQSKYKYLYRYRENILITAFIAVGSVAVSIMALSCMRENRYYGRIFGAVLPMAVLSLGFWFRSVKNRFLCFNRTYFLYGLTISLPLILNSVSLNILAQSDRIMISRFKGPAMAGIYTLAYQFAILISLFFDSVNQAWLPWFHDAFAAGEYKAIRENVKPLVVFGGYIGLMCIAAAPEAIWILGGNHYMEGRWVVAPIALGLVCKFVFANYEHIELHLKKTGYIAMGTAMAAALNLALNWIFIPRYGFVAAGCTTCFSYFALMTVHYFITTKIMKIKLYHNRFMYLSLAGVCAGAGGFVCLYPYTAARYGFAALLTAVYGYRNRVLLLNILRRKRKADK